jgi:hypothetical protein
MPCKLQTNSGVAELCGTMIAAAADSGETVHLFEGSTHVTEFVNELFTEAMKVCQHWGGRLHAAELREGALTAATAARNLHAAVGSCAHALSKAASIAALEWSFCYLNFSKMRFNVHSFFANCFHYITRS